MKQSERKYAYIFIQATSVLFLCLYVYLTFKQYSGNRIWFAVALLLLIVGYFRKMSVAILTSLFCMFGYGIFILYQLYISQSIEEIQWNDVIWLFIFPFISIISGLNNSERFPKLNHIQRLTSEEEEEEQQVELLSIQVELDKSLGYTFCSSAQLAAAIEAVAAEGMEQKYTFSLLLIEIQYFQQFYEEYGDLEARHLLNQIGIFINEVMPVVKLRVYLDKGTFAVILHGTESIDKRLAQLRLDHKFETMLLSRSRSDGYIRAKLIYGSADFPIHGVEANMLLNRAAQELHPVPKEVSR